ncbi:hypothetical protein Tco_0201612 [Tanacetum coccineum]
MCSWLPKTTSFEVSLELFKIGVVSNDAVLCKYNLDDTCFSYEDSLAIDAVFVAIQEMLRSMSKLIGHLQKLFTYRCKLCKTGPLDDEALNLHKKGKKHLKGLLDMEHAENRAIRK